MRIPLAFFQAPDNGIEANFSSGFVRRRHGPGPIRRANPGCVENLRSLDAGAAWEDAA